MTLKKMARPIGTLLTVSVVLCVLLGNQRQAYALFPPVDPNTGAGIVCFVYSELNQVGSPLPHLSAGTCPSTPTPSTAALRVVKVVNGGSARSSDFSLHVLLGGSDIQGSPQAGSSVGVSYIGIAPGSYSVSESGGPSGYTPAFSGDCNGSGSVSLAAGDSKTCTVTNTFRAPGAPQCSDGVDNDGDGLVDSNDPGCHSDFNPFNADSYNPNGNSEAATGTMQCTDGVDNDADGNIDAADPGCHSDFNASNNDSFDPSLNDEAASSGKPQCSDGIDNDGDGLIDEKDPGCHDDFNANNPGSYVPTRNDESATAPANNNTGSTGSGSNGPVVFAGGGNGGGGGGAGMNGPIIGSFGVAATSSGKVLGVSTTTPAPTPTATSTTSCDWYLTEFIKVGKENTPEQVKRLQHVLRDFEGASIDVNGVYDAKTLAAVHTFQTKYAASILTPWGIGKSTGFVYLTTRKKVNEIYCRNTMSFPLTASELQVIEQSKLSSGAPAQPSGVQPSVAPAHRKEIRTPNVAPVLETTAATSSSARSSGGAGVGGIINFLRDLLRRR